jgi:hypothetical protein
MRGFKAIGVVFWLSVLGVLLSHVSLQRDENGQLLNIDGRTIDVVGEWSQWKTHLQRHCDNVHALSMDDPWALKALQVVQNYSPPDSHSAALQSLIQDHDWFIAEFEFETLLPAVIIFHQHEDRLELHEQSIWSGSTAPWKAMPRIRAYLQLTDPQVPSHLIDCWDAHILSFDN